MKKFIAIITLVSMLSCVSCTSKGNGDSNPAPAESSTIEAAVAETTAAENSEEETAAETDASAEENKETYNWYGLSMYFPSEYSNIITSRGFPQAVYRDGDDQIGSLCYYTYTDPNVDSMTPESFMEKVYGGIEMTYLLEREFDGAGIKENNIESEEKVQVNGCDFIRQTGVYHCTDVITEKDIAYAAYFGIMDFPQDGKAPAVWIALSSHTDDASKAEIARIADTAAERCKPLE